MSSSVAHAEDAGLTAQAAAALGVANGPAPETGAPVGPFLVYPQLTLGAVYNDNLYPAATTRQAGFGFRVAPSVTAIDDEGLHKTSLYFNADAEWYPGANVPAAQKSPISLAAGASENWTPTPDLSLDAAAAFSRQNALVQSPAAAATGFIAAPSVVNLNNGDAFLDHAEADISLQRTLGGGFFVHAGARVENLAYESPPAASAPAGGQSYGASLRLGYALTPTVSGFVEGDANFLRRGIAVDDSDVESLVAGLSSDLISLFRGEVHAGYQRQTSPSGAFAATGAPTFGASLSYYPTAYLTLTASLDRAYAFSALATVTASGAPAAGPNLLQARLQADYAFASYWRAVASVSWARATSPGALETAKGASAQLAYNFWRNLDLTLGYQFARLAADGQGLRGYTQNVTTLGVTYKY